MGPSKNKSEVNKCNYKDIMQKLSSHAEVLSRLQSTWQIPPDTEGGDCRLLGGRCACGGAIVALQSAHLS